MLPAAPWKNRQSPPVQLRTERAERAREVGGVAGKVHPHRDGVAAVADERRDRALVPAPQLQRDHLAVDQAVDAPAVHDRAVGPALPPVHREVDLADAPRRPGRLEPLQRSSDHVENPRAQQLPVRIDALVALGRQQAASLEQRAARRGRVVGVVPVEENALQRRARELGDLRAQTADLGLVEPERVDVAQHHELLVRFQHEGVRLERQAVRRCAFLPPDEADHRQPEGRRDPDRCRARLHGQAAVAGGTGAGVSGGVGSAPVASHPSSAGAGRSGKSDVTSRTPVSIRIRSVSGETCAGRP